MKTVERARKLTVRVPATTANLGPGFDCLGLALDWWNTVRVEPIERGLKVECRCSPDTRLPCDGHNLVIRAMRTISRRAGRRLPPIKVWLDCQIPVGRGLGSSAAAIVAGLVAGNVLLGECLTQNELLRLAARIEGHPDNVAPALLGGLVIAIQDGRELRTARSPFPRDLDCVLFIPKRTLSTKAARRVLPARVPRADAVYNAGRVALWIAALHERRWEWLDWATRDRLHQPYRGRLVRGMEQLFAAARRAGARGVALSGAGPSLVAFTDRESQAVAAAMAGTAARLGIAGEARIVKASTRGAYATARGFD